MKKNETEKVYVGEFWFSDNPENKVHGYIKDKNGIAILHLSKSFNQNKIQVSQRKMIVSKRVDGVILGNLMVSPDQILPSSEKITLVGLHVYQSGTEDIKSYRFDYMIFEHFQKEEDIGFHKISFTFNGLFEFIGRGILGITQQNSSGESALFNPEQINIKIEKEYEPISWGKIDNNEISIFNNGKSKMRELTIQNRGLPYRGGIRKFTVEDEVYLSIKSDENTISLIELRKYLIGFQRLFSLILQRDIHIADIQFSYKYRYTEAQKKSLETTKDTHIGKIDVLINDLSMKGFMNSNDIVDSQEKDSIFLYDEVIGDFPCIIQKYFENTEKHKTIYNLYYATLQNQGLHLENQFLNLIQAIEGMYWKSNITVDIRGKTYNISGLSRTQREKEENEVLFTLCKKLESIEEYLGIQLKLSETGKNLNKDIRNIRDVFSHGGNREDLIDINLVNIVELLYIALELFILKELGINDALYLQIKNHKVQSLQWKVV